MPDWQEIISRDGTAVWGSLFRILGNRADADECFQEVFVGALEVSRREEVRHWRPFLLRLASARAADRLRQRVRIAPREEPIDWDTIRGPAPSPGEIVENDELADRLREALARIPSKQAEIFCLQSLEGWSYEEIAAHLGISVDDVGVTLHRARKRLRELLDPATGESLGPVEDRAPGAPPARTRKEPT